MTDTQRSPEAEAEVERWKQRYDWLATSNAESITDALAALQRVEAVCDEAVRDTGLMPLWVDRIRAAAALPEDGAS